jgi:hypothetical protein
MNYFRQLFTIGRMESMMAKHAGEGAGLSSVRELKQTLWTGMKAASRGELVDLAKMALKVANEVSICNQTKLANAIDRDLLAVSFATAKTVDDVICKQAYNHEISSADAEKLLKLNAESAIDDLLDIAKLAAPDWLTHPATLGAMGGGLIGAGVGAWTDPEQNRGRGALFGGVGGAALGGLGGLAYKHFKDLAIDNAAAAEKILANETAEKIEQARAGYTNMGIKPETMPQEELAFSAKDLMPNISGESAYKPKSHSGAASSVEPPSHFGANPSKPEVYKAPKHPGQ